LTVGEKKKTVGRVRGQPEQQLLVSLLLVALANHAVIRASQNRGSDPERALVLRE
jgi:hypothetical protein